MKSLLPKFVYIISLLAFFTACSITPIQTLPEIKEELSEEELERQRILEHYRLMRARQWDKINTKKTYYRMPKKTIVTIKPKQERPPEIKYVDIGEQNVEIEQNVVFFCMNRKKFQKFENEDDCLTFTKDIQDKCADEFESGDARLTHCIKSRLKY